MKIAVVQTRPRLGDVAGNLERARALIEDAKVGKVDLVVLPELFATGYCFPDAAAARELAEPVPGGPTTAALQAIAKAAGAEVVVGGVCERADDRLYNAAAIVGASGWLATYRKAHLFFEEKLIFTPGERRPPVFQFKGGLRVGVMICYDWRFPEAARALAIDGADVIAHPSNLVVRSSGPDTLKVRAADNRVFWALADRVGEDARPPREPLRFLGRSQVVDPVGARLVELSETDEGVGVVDVDPFRARDKVVVAGGRDGVTADVLADRREDLYPLRRSAGGGRYVVQRHDVPDGTHHFDFMLEWGDPLRTWTFEQHPRPGLAGRRIHDHRRLYLDYEGPIDVGPKGSVRILERGTFAVESETLERIDIRLAPRGEGLAGALTLVRVPPPGTETAGGPRVDTWRLERSASS